MKRLLTILIIVFALVFLFSLAMLIFESCQGQKEIKYFEEVFLLATTPLTEKNPPIEEGYEEQEKKSFPDISLDALRKENPDCAAWIYIEDTNINYPVMQTEEYLYKNFYGSNSKSGTPFVDSRCTLESDNIIIYAHNMLNGTMFADL